jgi:hypothetical protein
MKIIKIHGTSGAGKTTAVLSLMERTISKEVIGNPKRPEAYKLKVPELHHPLYVLGSYENTCGGMDTVSDVHKQIELIQSYAGLGHVIYEGLLLSTYYGSVGAAVADYGKRHIWAFLDTPVDICIERVKQRRLAAGNTKPLNERNTRERIKPINSLKARLTRMGANVIDLHYDQDMADQLVEAFNG